MFKLTSLAVLAAERIYCFAIRNLKMKISYNALFPCHLACSNTCAIL